jgi:hypothetical protein
MLAFTFGDVLKIEVKEELPLIELCVQECARTK